LKTPVGRRRAMRKWSGKKVAVPGLGFALILVFGSAAFAAGFSPANVDYSADRSMSGDGNTIEGKVFYSPGKERMEWESGQHVTIMRQDKKLVWTLMPKEKMYMEIKFGEEKKRGGDYRDCDVRQTEVGKEVVNGIETRKSTVEISCPDKASYSGTLWLTKENIPMRMETSDKSDPSGKKVFRMELKNLKIAKQDSRIFDLPPGYTKFEMPAMGDMDLQKMMKSQSQATTPPPADPAPKPAETGRSYSAQPREKSAVDKILDPAQKIKNLLHW
jgi:hypothetical protein